MKIHRLATSIACLTLLALPALACALLGAQPVDIAGLRPTWEAQTCGGLISAQVNAVQMSLPGSLGRLQLPLNTPYLLVEQTALTLQPPGRAEIDFGAGNKMTIYAPQGSEGEVLFEKWNGVRQPVVSAAAGQVVESGDACSLEILTGSEVRLEAAGTRYLFVVLRLPDGGEEVQVAVLEGAVALSGADGSLLARLEAGEALRVVNATAGSVEALPASPDELIANLEDGLDLFGEPNPGNAPGQVTATPTPALSPSAPVPATLQPSPTATLVVRATRTPVPSRTATLPPTSTSPPPADIVLWHSRDEAYALALNTAAGFYMQLHPNLTIEIVYVSPSSLANRLAEAVKNNRPPTLVIATSDQGWRFYENGWVRGLGDLADETTFDGVNLQAIDQVLVSEKPIGLPVNFQGVVLYRNTKIIPEATGDFDELLKNALTVSAEGGGDLQGAYFALDPLFTAAHLYGLDSRLVDEEGEPGFEGKGGIRWLALLAQMADGGKISLADSGYAKNAADFQKTFMQGKAGYIVDGTWNMYRYQFMLGEKQLAIDPWPVSADAQLSGFLFVDAVYLCSNIASENETQAGWAFMKFLVSVEGQTVLRERNQFPVNINLGLFDPLMQQAATAFASNTLLPYHPRLSEYWTPLSDAIQSVIVNQKEAADAALKIAAAQIRELLKP